MFPAWLSKRRNEQKLKQNHSDQYLLQLPYADDSSRNQRIQDTPLPTTRFAQALSLHGVINKVRECHLEAELAEYLAGRKEPDSMPSSQCPSQMDILSGSPSKRKYADTRFGAAECIRHNAMSSYSFLQEHSPISILSKDSFSRPRAGDSACVSSDSPASNKSFSNLRSKTCAKDFSKDCRRYCFCLQNSPIDNDTENSTILTPDSIESSFGSESSSEGSSEVHKSTGLMESGHSLLQWLSTVTPFELENMEGRETHIPASQPCYFDEAIVLPAWQGGQNMVTITECCSDLLTSDSIQRPALHGQYVTSGGTNCSSLSYPAGSPSLFTVGNFHMHDLSNERGLDSLCGALIESNLEQAEYTMHEKSEVRLQQESTVDHSSFDNGLMQLPCDGVGEGNSSSGIVDDNCEENRALIALQYPKLMLSSECQDRVGSCPSVNVLLNMKNATDRDGNFEVPECEGRHSSDILQTSEFIEDQLNVLATSRSVTEGLEGYSKPKYDGYLDDYIEKRRRQRGSSFSAVLPEQLQGIVGDSVAFVQMSNTPYEDFRQSMYEMIMEQDLEEYPMEVEDLLRCYLSLNSPELHPLIEEVFSDVWSSVLMNAR